MKIIFGGIILLILLSCSTSEPQGNVALLSNRTLHLNYSIHTIGAMSDPHGDTKSVEIITQKLKDQGAQVIIIAGDLPLNEELRSGVVDEQDDTSEITRVLSAAGKVGLPVYVIPGNHETQIHYTRGLREAQKMYPSIIDLTQYRYINSTGVDFISLPGYQIEQDQDHRYIPKNGYFLTPSLLDDFTSLSKITDGPTLLITHGPPFTGAIRGPGTIQNGLDVGDKYTTGLLQQTNISLVVSGHIHEAGGLAATLNGQSVTKSIWHSTTNKTIVLSAGSTSPWQLLNGSISSGLGVLIQFNTSRLRFTVVSVD